MPASLYYGQGLRSFLVDFLASNETTRNQTKPWQLCQHGQIVAIDVSDLCVWVEATAQESSYTVWAVASVLETPESCWAKFLFRTLLTIYALYVLWARYYCHYVILLSNLRQVGISPQYTRYKIVVGDPAYAILSDPVVSVGMVVDTLWGVPYIAVALIQVTQFQDVWFAYLFMQVLSAMVKKWRWEASFPPVDPGFLAIAAYIYCGPVVSVMGTTRLVWLFHESWSLFLPEPLQGQAIEGITGMTRFQQLLAKSLVARGDGNVFDSIKSAFNLLTTLHAVAKTLYVHLPLSTFIKF
ncbi:unnamed protein product [Aphanomyces euteiches]